MGGAEGAQKPMLAYSFLKQNNNPNCIYFFNECMLYRGEGVSIKSTICILMNDKNHGWPLIVFIVFTAGCRN